MIWAQAFHEHYANQYRVHDSRYAVDDKIWLNIRNIRTKRSNKKLSNKNDESFQVTQVVSSHVYRLELSIEWIIHNVFHISLLRKIVDDSLSRQAFSKSLSNHIDNQNAKHFEVETILVSEIKRNHLHFLMKWSNKILRHEWISIEDLDFSKLIENFYKNHSSVVDVDSWAQYTRESSIDIDYALNIDDENFIDHIMWSSHHYFVNTILRRLADLNSVSL